MRASQSIIVLFAVLFAAGSAWADNKSIQGTVTGADGKPLVGADVRAERLDAKAPPTLTKTDAKGQYIFKALPVGAYAITAIVKSVPRMRASVRTRSDGWAKVDFDLRITPDSKSIKKHWVWVKGEPGSHIGGRWVEVDQVANPGTSAVETIDGADVDRMQRDLRLNTGGTPGR
jgi:Carboxypeptidase regulatory-like domain